MLDPMGQIIIIMHDSMSYRISKKTMNFAHIALSMLIALLLGYVVLDRLGPKLNEAI